MLLLGKIIPRHIQTVMTQADHFCLNLNFSYIPGGMALRINGINSPIPGFVFHSANLVFLTDTQPKAGKDKQRCRTVN